MNHSIKSSRIFSLVLFLTLVTALFLWQPRASVAAGETAVVAADILNVRNGPGTGYGLVTQVGLNERLPVLDKSGDWYNVLLASGSKGWVAGWLVQVERPPAAPTPAPASGTYAVVKSGAVNVRSGPGTGYGLVTQVGAGERFSVLEKSGDWYKVRLNSGAAGWMAGWLLNIETSGPPALPPAIPPAQPSTGSTQAGAKVATVTGSSVNVRSGPGTSSGVIGKVTLGDTLLVLEQSGDWYRVIQPSGVAGWVAGWLVSVKEAPPAQPEPPAGNGGVSRGGDRGGEALSLKISDSKGETTAVIEADTPFDYTSFFMGNPDRLVLDLKGLAIGKLPLSTDVNSKTVRQVRAGQYQRDPDITRVVVDLSGGAQYMITLSTDRKKLTVKTYIPDIAGSYKGKVIAIDPGHGGSDPGAIGPGGTEEEDVTLDVAKRAAKLLESRGAKVIMARSGDYDVGLYERTDKANNAKADIFVSIHMNANNDAYYGGTSTYIYSGSSEPGQAARIQESGRLARYVQAELVKALGLRDIGVKSANFAVVRTSEAPAILVEVAFISNVSEEKLMATDSFKNKAAEAIIKGIGVYFSERRTA